MFPALLPPVIVQHKSWPLTTPFVVNTSELAAFTFLFLHLLVTGPYLLLFLDRKYISRCLNPIINGQVKVSGSRETCSYPPFVGQRHNANLCSWQCSLLIPWRMVCTSTFIYFVRLNSVPLHPINKLYILEKKEPCNLPITTYTFQNDSAPILLILQSACSSITML